MTLKEKYQTYFRIGTAVSRETIQTHQDLLFSHFNSITCENEMKPVVLCPEEGCYQFQAADEIVTAAKRHQLEIRFHTLIWHNQTPKWLWEKKDRESLLKQMHQYITAAGAHFGQVCSCVDVVNEAIEDKGTEVMRQSPWSGGIGPDFMNAAFLYAREAFPEAILYYNDYNEYIPEKRDKIYKKLKEMLSEGIPVGGMGMQMHASLYGPSADTVKAAIEQYASLGLRIQVTELDVSLFRFDDASRLAVPERELLKAQAEQYRSYFKIFREYKDIIDTVTLWGMADDRTWLDQFPVPSRKNWPLLFDEMHLPKEAFDAIVDF